MDRAEINHFYSGPSSEEWEETYNSVSDAFKKKLRYLAFDKEAIYEDTILTANNPDQLREDISRLIEYAFKYGFMISKIVERLDDTDKSWTEQIANRYIIVDDAKNLDPHHLTIQRLMHTHADITCEVCSFNDGMVVQPSILDDLINSYYSNHRPETINFEGVDGIWLRSDDSDYSGPENDNEKSSELSKNDFTIKNRKHRKRRTKSGHLLYPRCMMCTPFAAIIPDNNYEFVIDIIEKAHLLYRYKLFDIIYESDSNYINSTVAEKKRIVERYFYHDRAGVHPNDIRWEFMTNHGIVSKRPNYKFAVSTPVAVAAYIYDNMK